MEEKKTYARELDNSGNIEGSTVFCKFMASSLAGS
jgi:hypothetical protein